MTIEAAVALSAIVVVFVLCLSGIAAMVTAIRIADAASEAARLAARGDDDSARRAIATLAPSGSGWDITGTDLVTVSVFANPLGGLLPGVRISAAVVTAREGALR